MITVYGIPNCNTVKKAREWLDTHAIAYTFHDYKKQPPTHAQLQQWADALGWQALLNTRGTTWRTLSDEQRADVDQSRALALMADKPSLIKRPLIALDGGYLLGFDATDYARALLGQEHKA